MVFYGISVCSYVFLLSIYLIVHSFFNIWFLIVTVSMCAQVNVNFNCSYFLRCSRTSGFGHNIFILRNGNIMEVILIK
jgi:hypothetical protein